jgi:hypothetical protein
MTSSSCTLPMPVSQVPILCSCSVEYSGTSTEPKFAIASPTTPSFVYTDPQSIDDFQSISTIAKLFPGTSCMQAPDFASAGLAAGSPVTFLTTFKVSCLA